MDHFVIEPLARGYVIKRWTGKSYHNPDLAAGCTNFDDLVEALRVLIGGVEPAVTASGEVVDEKPCADEAQVDEPAIDLPAPVEPAVETEAAAAEKEPLLVAKAPEPELAALEPPPRKMPQAPNTSGMSVDQQLKVASLKNAHKSVYDHLWLCAEKTGDEVVTISLATLAEKAGVSKGSISFIVGQLVDRGLIERVARGTTEVSGFRVIGALAKAKREFA